MKKLTIRCSADWIRSYVMEKGAGELKPMEIMRDYLERLQTEEGKNISLQMPGEESRGTRVFQILDMSFYHVSAVYDEELIPEETVLSLLSGIMKNVFELTEETMSANIRFVAEELSEADAGRLLTKEEPEQDKTEQFTQEQETLQPQPPTTEEILDAIRDLKGASQFIALCEEIHAAAPLLRERGLEDVFQARSYLFSIDVGNGVGRSVSELANLMVSEELIPAAAGLCYERLPAEPAKEGITFSPETAEALSQGMQVLLVDITEWIDRMDQPVFRNYLYLLSQLEERAIFVFRVPYLEQSELDRIASALSDLLTVQTVVFVPITSEDLQDIARQSLADRGFEAGEGVWDLFQQRIAEEKSDGYFYGVQTVKKIVNEMIYQQVRNSAMNEQEEIHLISADSLRQFVRRNPAGISAEEELSRLIGVEKVRTQIEEILCQMEYAASHDGVEKPMMHMRFIGNPGTGKTTVARILGRMLRERGLLSKGYFYEHAGGDFIASYVGQTAPKVAAICRDAYGSVLFIDEAYTLANANYRGGQGFAKEAVDALIAQMENHREDFLVILAGYPGDMERLMKLNAGFAGRVPYVIEFPNYSREELAQIFMAMLKESTFRAGEGLEQAVSEYFQGLDSSIIESENFSNARFVRNIFEKTWSKTVMRAQIDGSPEAAVTVEDFQAAVAEDVKSYLDKQGREPRPGYHLGLL